MKKIVTYLVSALLILSPVAAYEWGGLVSANLTGLSLDPSNVNNIFFNQSDGISLWANIPLTNDSNWHLATQASYTFNHSFVGMKIKDGESFNVFDIDLLKLSGAARIGNTSFSLGLGRFTVVDNTAKVFAQNCDGASLKIAASGCNFGVYGGFTGLLNGNKMETIAKDNTIEFNSGDFYSAAHPYVPLIASLDFPAAFLGQSFGMQVSGFLDLSEEKYDRYYGTLYLKGPVAGPLYYNLTSCFGTEDFTFVNNYSILSFQVLVNSITFNINCEYASGEQFIFKPFKGFNSVVAYNSPWTSTYSGLLLPGIEFIFSTKQISIEFDGKFVMLYPEDELIMQGVSADFKTVANVCSDVSLEIGAKYYYDLESSGEFNIYGLNLGLSISF